MLKISILAAAALAGLALAGQPTAWAPIPELPGTQYVGRSDANGQLVIAGWRSDGSMYVRDGLHALAFISTPEKMGLMTDAFRAREPDGAAAWTVKEAISFTADRNGAYIEINCGEGTDFDPNISRSELIVGIVPITATVTNGRVTHRLGAARVDLKTGALLPIDPAGITCHQEELN